jgi:hypothetical protein
MFSIRSHSCGLVDGAGAGRNPYLSRHDGASAFGATNDGLAGVTDCCDEVQRPHKTMAELATNIPIDRL